MQKHFSFSFILIIVFFFSLSACDTSKPPKPPEPTATPYAATATLHPNAIMPMTQLASLQKIKDAAQKTKVAVQATMDIYAIAATYASYTKTPTPLPPTDTPTPTLTPTNTFTPTTTPRPTPMVDAIKKLLNKSIDDELSHSFGVGRTVTSIEFIPATGNNIYENFIVNMNCDGGETPYCLSTQAFVDLINACKNSGHKIDELIPDNTKFMQLWVFQPNAGEQARIGFDINWADIQSYINGDITSEVFASRVRELPLPPP